MTGYSQSLTGGLGFVGSQLGSFSTIPFPSVNVPSYTDVRFFTGKADVPRDIFNQRNYSLEVMRRMGTPVLLKRMYTSEDVQLGVARESATQDSTYEQPTYAADELSHGVGYVSVDAQDGEWYDPATGQLYFSPMLPNPTYLPAPRYRGYGPGFLTYAILPDRPEDVWKLTPQGALSRMQTAMVQLPWWPQVGDNDILTCVRLDNNGKIVQSYERYKLKAVTPITMRGLDRAGNREFSVNAGGNRFWIGQQAECVKVPAYDQVYSVEIDR